MEFFISRSKRILLLLSITGVVAAVSLSAVSSLAGITADGPAAPLWRKPGVAVDHFAARITPQGLQSLLKAILEKYPADHSRPGRSGYTIPKRSSTSVVTLAKEKYATLISLSQEFFELDFVKGVSLFTRIAPIQLSASVASESIVLSPVLTDANGFDADLSVKITDFVASVPKISVCDREDCDSKLGLRMDLNGIALAQSAHSVPILVKARVSCRLEKGGLKFKILRLSSNLEATHAPVMDVSFNQIVLPAISIESEGHKVSLDTSQLKTEIQKHSPEIGTAIVHSAATFFADDLAELVNKLLSQESLDVSVDEDYVNDPLKNNWLTDFVNTPADPLQRVLTEVQQATSSVRFDGSLGGISFEAKGILDTSFQLALNLNGKTLNPSTRLDRCSQHSAMGVLKFESAPAPETYGFAVALSEPLVNSALDLANSTGLVGNIMAGLSGMEGITLGTDGVKLFFVRKDNLPKIIAIISLDVDISKRPSSGFWASVKQDIGILLEETFGAGGHLKFPLQIEIDPSLVQDPATGETVLSLKTISPIHQTSLDNTYGCAGNMSDVTSTVRSSFLTTLTDSLKNVVGKTQSIPISGWIKNTGIHFKPTQVDVESSGHLVIYGNLEKIDWNKLSPPEGAGILARPVTGPVK